MAKIKVVAGDLDAGAWDFIADVMSRPSTSKSFWWGEKYDLRKQLVSFEQLDEQKARSLAGAAGWGFVGTVALGPLGLLAGALFGGRAQDQYTFAAELSDGQKFMATCPGKIWTKLQGIGFDKARVVGPDASASE